MEIWGFWRHILILQKFPALCSAAVNSFQGGFSMKIYHCRHWNIIQISHTVFGACLGFPVSSEISNYKAISWGRCRIWQIILLTESRNDPHHIWACTTVPDDGFVQVKFIAPFITPFQPPSIKPLNKKEQSISLLHKCILKLPGCSLSPGAADTSLPPKQRHHWSAEISL